MKKMWGTRVLAMLLVLALTAGLVPAALAANSEAAVAFKQVPNDTLDTLIRPDLAVGEIENAEMGEDTAAYQAHDLVRVSIILEDASTLEAYSDAAAEGTLAEDAAAVSYRAALQRKQDSVVRKISSTILGREDLDVVWNLTLVANMITWCLGANESFQAAELDKRSKFLGHRSEKYGTSDNLYYLMGIISSALIILNYALSGNANKVFWTLFSFSSIVFMLNYLFMFPAAIKLRFIDDTPRQYAVPGGKVGMVVCGVICFLCVALACYFLIDFDVTGYAFWMQLIGVLLTVAVGYWLYRAGKKKN